MAQVDTYTIVGTSVLDGVLTYRFANRSASARTSILKANDHTDINLFDITNGKSVVAMSKDEAIKWLHTHQPKVCKHVKYGAAVMPVQRGAGGGGNKLKSLKKEMEAVSNKPAAKAEATRLYVAELMDRAKAYRLQAEEWETEAKELGKILKPKAVAAPKKSSVDADIDAIETEWRSANPKKAKESDAKWHLRFVAAAQAALPSATNEGTAMLQEGPERPVLEKQQTA